MKVLSFVVEHTKSDRGAGNGYVAVPPSHPVHGMHYHEIERKYDIDVYGGITFSDYLNNPCRIGEGEDIPEDYWIIGFDTQKDCDNKQNWSMDSVKYETELFKRQIEDIV